MNGKSRLIAYLQENEVPYLLQHHSKAYTAEEVAASEHVPGRMMTKVVVVFAAEKMVLLVLSANDKVDLSKVALLFGTEDIRLADEAEFEKHFPDCEGGAMPPFGNLYNLPVYVDFSLAENEFIVFQACTHTDTIKIAYSSFEQLVNPVVADLIKEEELSFVLTIEATQ